MKESIWVAERIVLAIHEDQLAQHGGSPGVSIGDKLRKNEKSQALQIVS